MIVVVLGGSGFVGSHVRDALIKGGHEVRVLPAPRIDKAHVGCDASIPRELVDEYSSLFAGADAVVNCAGNPDASERDLNALLAANAISPAVVGQAAKMAQVGRLIHVSSAVVQGRRNTLDEGEETEAFSPYAQSKAEGERRVRRVFPQATIYRPPSVHAPSRRVTSMTARIASSPLATVAAPGHQPTPQALIENVAAAIAFLATAPSSPPAVVIHPWEGLSSSELMELLGGKRPLVLPRALARAICRGLEVIGSGIPLVAANARRVEMLWFGQAQGESWLTTAGWRPPEGKEAWRELGETFRGRRS